MLGSLRIAVIVPAYNERRLIRSTLLGVPGWVDRLVVVDDGSDDGTAVAAAAVDDERLVIVRHPENRGVGRALATGYARAFDEGADVAAVMAADDQMDPADLAALVQPIADGRADYVKGNRLAHPEVRARMPSLRYAGNHVLSVLTRLATGLPVHDSQCGYTALSRHGAIALRLPELWSGYGYPNDLLGAVQEAGLALAEVTVRPVYRDEDSGIGLRHALVVIPFVLARVLVRRLRRAVMHAGAPRAAELPPSGRRLP